MMKVYRQLFQVGGRLLLFKNAVSKKIKYELNDISTTSYNTLYN